MWASASSTLIQALRCRRLPSPPPLPPSCSPVALKPLHIQMKSFSSEASSHSNPFSFISIGSRRGKGRDFGARDDRPGGRGGGSDRIDALGRLLTKILRHTASELKLDIRSDGYVKVRDVLRLNMTTFAKVPLSSHTIEEVKEAVRRDNKRRFSLLEENRELLIRANQGHNILCVHGTYKQNLESILQSGLKRVERLHVHFSCGLPTDGEVVSGMRRDVDVLIFLDVRKALQEGMKLYISDNNVILTEGFNGIVPVEYFGKIETWPGKEPIPFRKT